MKCCQSDLKHVIARTRHAESCWLSWRQFSIESPMASSIKFILHICCIAFQNMEQSSLYLRTARQSPPDQPRKHCCRKSCNFHNDILYQNVGLYVYISGGHCCREQAIQRFQCLQLCTLQSRYSDKSLAATRYYLFCDLLAFMAGPVAEKTRKNRKLSKRISVQLTSSALEVLEDPRSSHAISSQPAGGLSSYAVAVGTFVSRSNILKWMFALRAVFHWISWIRARSCFVPLSCMLCMLASLLSQNAEGIA